MVLISKHYASTSPVVAHVNRRLSLLPRLVIRCDARARQSAEWDGPNRRDGVASQSFQQTTQDRLGVLSDTA